MGKLDQTLRARRGVRGAIASEQTPTGKTGNQGDGYTRDAKGELFLLAVANFVGEDTFYEDAKGRDSRFKDLIAATATSDPEWTFNLLRWLRGDANMRSASIVGAVEAARMLSGRSPGPAHAPRQFIDVVCQRADEPGEALAYWLASYGRPLPKWLKRGLGDAILRLYTPFNVLKWDSDRNAVRFADVLEYTQIARSQGLPKENLFKFLLDSRHGRADWTTIPMFAARKAFDAIPVAQRRGLLVNGRDVTSGDSLSFGQMMRDAGVTWEYLSGWLQGPMDAGAWEALIDADRMGYMALVRNLRNFDQAGISKAHKQKVAGILADPARVEISRQLPMRFLSAYNAAPSDFWKPVLDDAATHALRNVPSLPGRTLVLVDTSGSMASPFSTHSGRRGSEVDQLKRWDAAALFGIALGRACQDADVVSYSGGSYGWAWGTGRSRNDSKQFDLRQGENLLAAVNRFRRTHFLNGGTDTAGAVNIWFGGHDRVILLTDEQANQDPHGVFARVPAKTPTYTFNLAGYQYGHAASGPYRFVVGGLSDAGFQMIAALEARQSGRWPWQK